ncbi:MAG TPA: cyclic nucleotide-binding domain-containing protein [Myxococcales bacterium]
MAKKPQVDVRKLKDEVADHLKKARFEKAAAVLEQLIAAEPKDMSHRLKLGDTLRRAGDGQRAIAAWQHAARFYADEGQLIKAIGAVKLVLEIEPRNQEAQRQLAEMNDRRMGKVTLESAGLAEKPVAKPLHPAAIELDAGPSEARAPAQPADDEPLELDDRRAGGPMEAIDLPPPDFGSELELDTSPPRAATITARIPGSRGRGRATLDPPPSSRELPPELDPDLSSQPAEQLPEDAILGQAEDLPAQPQDERVPPPEPEPSPPAPRETFSFSGEIEIEDESPRAGAKEAGGPIADLLSGVTAEIAVVRKEEDLDAAFDRAAPAAARRVPVKKVPLFDDLSQDAFVELVNKVGYHRHPAGERIIRDGDPGRSFFVIVEGKVRVSKRTKDGNELTLAHLGEGAFFGEMALLSGAPRTANVVAEEDTELLEVTDVVLRQLATKYPQVINSLKNFYRQRLLNNVMAISPLFKDFDPSERKAIVEKFRMKRATAGEVLIREGSNSDGLYVVLHGAVQVSTRKDGKEIELARLSEGEIFGEMSLLTRKPATATVSSRGNVLVLRLPRENFQELVVTHPQILELVSDLTDQRKSATEAILHGQGEGHDGMSFV